MKHLKLYEGYLSNKMKVIKDKCNKLKKIVDFIEKYDLNQYNISAESNDYLFEYIKKSVGDWVSDIDYYLVYEVFSANETKKQKLIDLPIDIIDELITTCEKEGRFKIEAQLEIGVSNIDTFINILKKHKEPMIFNDWMFSQLGENNLQDDANSFNFQNILFSTHPEAFTSFMNECIDSQKRSKEFKFKPLKIASGIERKYKKLFDDYKTSKDAEKYNL